MSNSWPTAFVTVKYSTDMKQVATCSTKLGEDLSKLLHELPLHVHLGQACLVGILQPQKICYASFSPSKFPNPLGEPPCPVITVHLKAPKSDGAYGLSDHDAKTVFRAVIHLLTENFNINSSYIHVEPTDWFDMKKQLSLEDLPISDDIKKLLEMIRDPVLCLKTELREARNEIDRLKAQLEVGEMDLLLQ